MSVEKLDLTTFVEKVFQ